MKKESKRVRIQRKDVDFHKKYSLEEAISLLQERKSVKFNETMEAVFMCAIDPKKGEQNIRGVVDLPYGTGKTIKIAVFAQGDKLQEAKALGVDYAGGEDLIDDVFTGRITDMDVCIATPDIMPLMSKIGKILGPKGIMPNPKMGTITHDIVVAVRSARQGQAGLRPDKAGIIHSVFGKVNFSVADLKNNFIALYKGLNSLKPVSVKGDLIKKIYISSSMGIGLAIDITKVLS